MVASRAGPVDVAGDSGRDAPTQTASGPWEVAWEEMETRPFSGEQGDNNADK